MIIRSNKINIQNTGILEAKYKDDQFIITHAQAIDPALEQVKCAKDNTNQGWSKSREWKMLAVIPGLEFVRHPEWFYEPKEINRWLRTDYGSQFKVSNP